MSPVRKLMLADEAATIAFAERLANVLCPGDLVLLEGELGAGKTFLVRATCRALGVPDDVPVTSPTFALVHELEGRHPIVHADLYRLEDPSELSELGLEERIFADAITFIEWGKRFVSELGEPTAVLELAIAGETARTVRIDASTGRLAGILDAL